MLPNKVKIPKDCDNRLRGLAGRTGLTPNILCRFGLVMSLEDRSSFTIVPSNEDGREFNRYTLLGDCERLYEAILVERHGEASAELLVAHITRGVGMIAARTKSLSDLLMLAGKPRSDKARAGSPQRKPQTKDGTPA